MATGSSLRVVVGGYAGLLPAGGVTWDYMQYPAGLRLLGHDVFYIEDTGLWPIYQTSGGDGGASSNVEHLASVMEAFDMSERWAYVDQVTGRTFGMDQQQVKEVCRSAEVFINISCSTLMRDDYTNIPARILIDTDPMFTQIQLETGTMFTSGESNLRSMASAHTHHFTFGESIGRPECLIPDAGFRWLTTRQPICLDSWPAAAVPQRERPCFTTVMNWAAGRTLGFDGQEWGQKDREFLKFLELPRRSDADFEIVVGQTGGSTFPHSLAASHGWQVREPHDAVPDWVRYRDFIAYSSGEFSVAKQTYVKAQTGWFSCRSGCYLAGSRPVVTQDTGWSRHLPSGEGLFAFTTIEEAAEALEVVAADPTGQGRKAREVAGEFLDARKVLGKLLADSGT